MSSSFVSKAFAVVNVAYLVSVAIAAISSFGLWYFGTKIAKAKDDELGRFKEEARVAVAKSNAQAAEANREAAKANERAAELQAASLPRSFDVHAVAAKLTAYAGTNVSLMTLMEFEPDRTTAQIRAALKEAKWLANGGGSSSGMGTMFGDKLSRPGVWIEANPLYEEENGSTGPVTYTAAKRAAELAKRKSAAVALAAALTEAGLLAKTFPETVAASPSGIGGPDVTVFVSLKPFPGMPEDLRVIGG